MYITLSLHTLVINIVAVTVHFLILLLFPINCSYLNLRFSYFCASSSQCHPPKEKGKGKSDEQINGVSFERILVGDTELRNTIPKSWQLVILHLEQMHELIPVTEDKMK